MIFLYGLKNCDRCRRALKNLRHEGFAVTFVDVRQQPPTQEQLCAWWQECGEAMLNRHSTTWKSLTAHEREQDPIDLLQRYPSLIKRPLIVMGEKCHLGWTEAGQRRREREE